MTEAVIAPRAPARGMPPAPVRAEGTPAKRDPDQDLVDWSGRLPRQSALFLGRLSPAERRDVFAILGKFQEVRGLVGAGRLLHAYLREGPLAAARGEISFAEFMAEKEGLVRAIGELRQRLNRAAIAIRLILPPVSVSAEGGIR